MLKKPRTKNWMWIDVRNHRDPEHSFHLAPVTQIQISAVARLMDSSYRKSIDYDGETFEQCSIEIAATLDGKYGPLIQCATIVNLEGDRAAAAVVVSLWGELPLLVYCMTDPIFQGQGRSSILVRKCIYELAQEGYSRLCLLVAKGNTPAEKLYEKLGFKNLGPAIRSGNEFLPPVLPETP